MIKHLQHQWTQLFVKAFGVNNVIYPVKYYVILQARLYSIWGSVRKWLSTHW
jgi:hypothetical protein